MRGTSSLSLVGLVFLASAVTWTPSVAQMLPTIEMPKGPDLFRVNPATGTLMPMEFTMSKVKYAGTVYFCYLPGATSPVAFPYGEPHVFAARYFGPPSLEEARRWYKLERLAVKDGKRYGTKIYVPLQVTTHGEVVHGLDPTKKNRGALTFLYTPVERLAPGEYALSLSGLITAYAGGGASVTAVHAFRVAEAAATAAAPPAWRHSAQR